MIFTLKACSKSLFNLNKGFVARYTNPQVHRLHLATAPMSTLVTGFNYVFKLLNECNLPPLITQIKKIDVYIMVMFYM